MARPYTLLLVGQDTTPPATERDVEEATSAAVSTHEGELDPHPQYATDAALAALPTLAHGTYTPVLTPGGNVDAATPFECMYSRVGDVVTVAGRVSIDATAGATLTTVTLSLPIASDLQTLDDLMGSGAANFTTSHVPARIIGDAANDAATFTCSPPTGAVSNYAFTFVYRVR